MFVIRVYQMTGMKLKRKFFFLAISIICFCTTGKCQDTLSHKQSGQKNENQKPTITRQYIGADFNVLQPFRFFGLEGSIFVAPLNWLSVRYTGISFDKFVVAHKLLDIPYRSSISNIGEIRFQYPFQQSTFTCVFIGIYVQEKKGEYIYDETFYQSPYSSYQDSYSYKLLVEGATIGISVVPEKTKHLFLDFYAGGGYVSNERVTRASGYSQFATDKSSDIEQKIASQGRMGFCIGVAF